MAQNQTTVDSLKAKLASLKSDQANMAADMCSELKKLATLKAQDKLMAGADIVATGFGPFGVHGDWSLYEKMTETKNKVKEIFDRMNEDSVEEMSGVKARLALEGEGDEL